MKENIKEYQNSIDNSFEWFGSCLSIQHRVYKLKMKYIDINTKLEECQRSQNVYRTTSICLIVRFRYRLCLSQSLFLALALAHSHSLSLFPYSRQPSFSLLLALSPSLSRSKLLLNVPCRLNVTSMLAIPMSSLSTSHTQIHTDLNRIASALFLYDMTKNSKLKIEQNDHKKRRKILSKLH